MASPISINPSMYRNLELPFSLKNTEIDYFHIQPDILSLNAFQVSEERINLEAGQYLDLQRHFQSLDDSLQETVVLNVPVGHGKTTLCYKLIQKYYDEGYHIIVCSPFQKLVEKDHKALRTEMPHAIIFNYKELNFDEESFFGSFEQHLAENEARIHIMTINCLLKNPGDDKFEQAFHKSRFLQKLKNSIRNKGEKVVFFFDEIHECVTNFKNEFIPNLTTWRELTHKCFISSATFTSASLPVIRHISLLTVGRIRIYDTLRKKSRNQADLHLHITTNFYSSKNLSPLGKISDIIRTSAERGSKVNILCAYKIMVNALTDRNSSNHITQSVLALQPNICTSDTDNEFKPTENNIGTNFKAGVNIEISNSSLIIIMPIVNKSNPFASYGIFSDGIPAIIQAIARLRNGGNIHIFMYAPDAILDLENHNQHIPEELLQEKINRPYKKVNESYDWMKQKYDTLRRHLDREITFLTDMLNEFDELKYHYPTFQEALIEKSQSYLLAKNEWMGKYISPYLLWAAINDQFCNATLRRIIYQTKSFKIVRLTPENMQSELSSLLSNNTTAILREETIRQGFDRLLESLNHSEQSENDTTQHFTNDFYLNGKQVTYGRLKSERSFNFGILKILLSIKNIDQEINKDSYLRTCIANVASYGAISNQTALLTRIYRQFHSIKERYVELVRARVIQHKSRLLLQPNFDATIPDDFIKDTIKLVYALKEEDKILKAFTFFHNHKGILDPESITPDMKKVVVNELGNIFLDFTEERLTYEGIKLYVIGQAIERQQVVQNVNIL